MLDVLVPVAEALKAGSPLAALPQAAAERLTATRDMVATRGRASFLGERSRGHEDPGAASATLLVEAVCGALGGRA
jgi:phosphoenolpyruvate---glycerone phosphotransferase subunit DhaL